MSAAPDLLQTETGRWALALVVLFPLFAVLLGRAVTRMRLREDPLEGVLRTTRNAFLPLLVAYLFVAEVLRLPSDAWATRLTLTLTLLVGVFIVLSFTSTVVFGAAPTGSTRARTPKLLRDLVLVLLVGLGGVAILAAVWGQDVAAPFAALGIGSVVIGLALQETLGNVMSGIALLMERPFAEGDWIELGEVEGRVDEINWRAVRLTNREGDTVIVPHGEVAGGVLVNNSAPTTIDRSSAHVGFAYDDPPNEVKRVLLSVAATAPGVRADPPPQVQTLSFDDSSVGYVMHYWIDDPALKLQVSDQVMTRIWYASKRAGLTIPFPIRTLYDGDREAEDPAVPALEEAREAAPFSGVLETDDLDEWGRGARLERFADGEVVLGQGTLGQALHLIVAGRARLSIGAGELYAIGAGDFFGETTVFSGAASPYAVTAEGDLSVLSFPAEAIGRLIERKPSVAVEIGKVVDARRRAVAEAERG